MPRRIIQVLNGNGHVDPAQADDDAVVVVVDEEEDADEEESEELPEVPDITEALESHPWIDKMAENLADDAESDVEDVNGYFAPVRGDFELDPESWRELKDAFIEVVYEHVFCPWFAHQSRIKKDD